MSRTRQLRSLAATVLVLGLVGSIYVFLIGWNQPLLDQHAFRQTQTALTAYWIAKGGPILAYETPVLGAPWAIPFEFPLYQTIAAYLHRASGVSLDSSGRLVSYLFFLLALRQVHRIIRRLGGPKELSFLTCGLLLLSPLYLFWSRTFMIESSALFFALWFVAAVVAHLHRPTWWTVVAMVVAASLAALVKATTFPAFAAAGCLLALRDLLQRSDRSEIRLWMRAYLPIALSLLAAFVLLLAWVDFSDGLRSQNLVGRIMVSANLSGWYYGTLDQRLGAQLWTDIIYFRSIAASLGSGHGLWIMLILLIICWREAWRSVAALIVLYLIPFLVFTNLHIVHDYYQYSNSLFLIGAFGVTLWMASRRMPVIVTVAILAIIVATQMIEFRSGYYRELKADHRYSRTLLVSNEIRRRVPETAMIVVLGYDWSSEIAYYSERRAMTIPPWVPPGDLVEMRTRPASFSGGVPVGAVVDCRAAQAGDSEWSVEANRLVEALAQDKSPTSVAGCTLYY